jgi:chromosomal replication initiator protein
MRKDIGDAAWRHWIKPLRISRLEDGTLTLEAESTLARERVSSQYADRLRVISAAEFNDVSPSIRHVEVRLASNRARKRPAASAKRAETGTSCGTFGDHRISQPKGVMI